MFNKMQKKEVKMLKNTSLQRCRAIILLSAMILVVVFFTNIISAKFDSSLDNGLVSYYKLDEISGSFVADILGLNNGTKLANQTGVTFNQSGKIGNSFLFYGASETTVNISDSPSFYSPTGYSVGLWVKTNQTNWGGVAAHIFGQWGNAGAGNAAWDFSLQDGKVLLENYDGSGLSELRSSQSSVAILNDSNWHFIVGVYNGGTGGTNAFIYIDGILNASGTLDKIPQDSSYPVTIGDTYVGGGTSLNPGYYDELFFYNRTLTPTEIAKLYNGGAGLSYNALDVIIENSRTVPASALQGSSQTFILNISVNHAITSAYLNYNGTRYSVSISAGDYTVLTSNFAIPLISASGTSTIFWELHTAYADTNTSTSSMTVTTSNLDNCSINKIVIYNFTMVDEIYQNKINGTTGNTSGKINLQIYSFGTKNLVSYYNSFMNVTNPFAICINSSVGVGEKFSLDAQIQYDSIAGANEYYYFQNETLNSTYIDKNITLYDLDDTHAQTARIIYTDSSGIPVEDALIEVQRKYVDEGVFKVVEIAKTDKDGITQAKIQLNDVIYNFIVKKNGVTLDSFNNKFVRCDNAIYNICDITLNSFSSYMQTKDYTIGNDFTFTLDYNRTTRTITSDFTIPSGSSSLVVLNATLIDNLGTTLACSDSITSSTGTLTCVVPNAIGNGTVYVKLFKDGVEQASATKKLERLPSDIYGSSLIFLLLFMYLMLIGIAIGDNPMVAGLFLIVGAILGVLMNFVASSGFIGAGATILWFIIAVVIMLIKGGKRN